MILRLLVLAALPVFAQSFDVDAPGFWSKGYSIPVSYTATRFVIDARSLDKAEKALPFCSWTPGPPPPLVAYARCRVSPETAQNLIKRLRLIKPIREYPDSVSIPQYPELYFKRDALSKELALIEDSAESIPAIRGLLEAQLATLDLLIKEHEAAKVAVVEAAVVSSSEAAVMEASLKVADALKSAAQFAEHPQQVHWNHHWARSNYAVCEQIPVIFVTRDSRPGGPTENSIRSSLKKLGEPFEEPGCRFSPAAMILSALTPAQLLPKLMKIDGVLSASISPRMRYKADLTDLERFDALSAELSSQAVLLEKVPTIRAFVRGELERIRGAADRLRRVKGRRLVAVKLAS